MRIGDETRALSDASESWINEQLSRRHRDGQNVCVAVVINTSGVNIPLTTPGCGSGGGGGRPPNQNERAVIDLWNRHRLNTASFTGGELIAFLKQLARML